MKLLIGTPIHESKDYCMERWIENVAKLQAKTPADLLIVDNSPGTDYVKKVKGYLKKYGVKNYKIEHIEIYQKEDDSLDEKIHERITRSREIIRQKIISGGYDAWFCWESDQIIPTDALNKLIDIMQSGDFSIVVHNCWGENDGELNFDLGVALVKKDLLENYEFLPKFGSDPNAPAGWYFAETWYKERLKNAECNYAEVYGLISPLYHLHNR